jgi:hypothetical protein
MSGTTPDELRAGFADIVADFEIPEAQVHEEGACTLRRNHEADLGTSPPR